MAGDVGLEMLMEVTSIGDTYRRYIDTNQICVQSVRGGVAPAAEQDDRPEVIYKPILPVEVGTRAFIVPVNHYSSAWVTNGEPAWTGTVMVHDTETGYFETKRTRYVLDTGYDH